MAKMEPVDMKDRKGRLIDPGPLPEPCSCRDPQGSFVIRPHSTGQEGGYFRCARCHGAFFMLMSDA